MVLVKTLTKYAVTCCCFYMQKSIQFIEMCERSKRALQKWYYSFVFQSLRKQENEVSNQQRKIMEDTKDIETPRFTENEKMTLRVSQLSAFSESSDGGGAVAQLAYLGPGGGQRLELGA